MCNEIAHTQLLWASLKKRKDRILSQKRDINLC